MIAAQSMTLLAENARNLEHLEREQLEREPSFVTAISPSSSSCCSIEKADCSCMSCSVAVDGRVFRRLQRYQTLAHELKVQSDMVATYLLTPSVRRIVFQQRKHWWQHPLHLATAGKGTFIQGRALLRAIRKYLQLSHAAHSSRRDAQQLAITLILSGFLSPVHEAPTSDAEHIDELDVIHDKFYEVVVPGAAAVIPTQDIVASATVTTTSWAGSVVLPVPLQDADKRIKRLVEPSLSVWAVTNGATRAGCIHLLHEKTRMQSLLGLPPKLRPCYAVVNELKYHSLVLFESDVARHHFLRIKLSDARVEYAEAIWRDDTSYATLTLRTSKGDVIESIAVRGKPEQEQWLLAFLNAGATFIETHPAIRVFADPSASLYLLEDITANGEPFYLSELQGYVAILTNIPSGSCHTNANQLSELVKLSRTYSDDGLKIVAFPCAQFGDAEFDTDEELLEHFQHEFGVCFPVLATRDVNGPHARDPMLFCKTRQPGPTVSAGNAFIENSFVKFLISRDGRVVKRFRSKDSPLLMETDLQDLLKTSSST
ncbi:hypothetical protein CCR75_001769 [Bremia lactucae]|uniref:Glutathione peroxidase n=1 Tax=Bremia lactucae TaxID=4779 RepID=A0A976FS54_BRELC|nr:hypothetical protein CCR75_001769 [Bremia lactucae]